MTTLSLTIDDQKAAVLEDKAKRCGLTTETLLLASIDNLITDPALDFENAMKHVLSKNHELYQRLA